MRGANAYDCGSWHIGADCVVSPVEIGGVAMLWCSHCRVLANLQAVSPRYETLHASGVPGQRSLLRLRQRDSAEVEATIQARIAAAIAAAHAGGMSNG